MDTRIIGFAISEPLVQSLCLDTLRLKGFSRAFSAEVRTVEPSTIRGTTESALYVSTLPAELGLGGCRRSMLDCLLLLMKWTVWCFCSLNELSRS